MSAHATDTQNRLLAAQPIYDRNTRVAAVELLYRDDLDQTAMDIGEAQATSELLLNLCTGITDQVDHYRKPAFINVSADFLLSRAFLPIDPAHVVIELVERIRPDADFIDAVAAWHRRGFRFALDDFEFTDAWRPLLEYASVIKVDVLNTPLEQALEYREHMTLPGCRWLAERVETEEVRAAYHDAGFHLYQGYFLARPITIYGKKLSAAAMQLTRVLGALYSDEPDMNLIMDLINDDPGLAMSLLKVVNSPLFRTRQPITSVQGVVLRLGLDNLRRWVVLIAAVRAGSSEVARLVLVRAKFCMAMCDAARYASLNPDSAFLAGLLSGADILLSVETESFLREVEVEPEVRRAVLNREGPLGQLLNEAIALERACCMKQPLTQYAADDLQRYRDVQLRVQLLFNEID